MLIHSNNNFSQLKPCLEAAKHFLLTPTEAHSICTHMVETIEQHWNPVCEQAELSEVDKNLFWQRQFLNPFSVQM